MRAIIREMFGELSLWGKFWLTIGLGTLAAAAAMSYDFGSSVSFKHALFLALLSIVTAFAPEAAYRQWKLGAKGPAIAIAVICAPMFMIEFYSHAGFTAGLRGHNITDAKIQNVKYDMAGDEVSEGKASLKMWTERLSRLETEHAWSATVTAEALRAQLPPLEVSLKREANNCGRRRCTVPDEGKGPAWQLLAKQKADIEAKIALAEEKADLTKKIEATKRILADRREKAAHTEFKHSAVDHQNQFLAKAVALIGSGSLEPSDLTSEAAQQSVNLAMAIAGTGLPAFALFIAGLYRREEDTQFPPRAAGGSEPAPTQIAETAYASPSITMPVARTAAAPQHRNMVVKATTNTIADLRRTLQGIGGAQPSYGTM